MRVNSAANSISKIAFSKKLFTQFKLHKEVYYSIKDEYKLSAQLVVRTINKVSDAYKVGNSVCRIFSPSGSIAYDERILRYHETYVSITTTGGRINMPFKCYDQYLFANKKGQADLVFRKGKFYLLQTCEVPEPCRTDICGFIGVDFGQTDIATTSDGMRYSSRDIKRIRTQYNKTRSSVQAKGTRSSRKLLKRLSGRERRFVSISNHTISKAIIEKAVQFNKGIAIENLQGIRQTAKPKSKALKTELNRWSFYQLRRFIEYKARLNGVQIALIPPAYTSKTCAKCKRIGNRKGKNFKCTNCGNSDDADINAAINISTWGQIVTWPEKSINMSCKIHFDQV